MARNRLSRRGRAIFAGIIAALILVAAGYLSGHHSDDKKDDHPAGPVKTPVATRDRSQDADNRVLNASVALSCSSIANKPELNSRTHSTMLTLHKLGGNSVGKRARYQDFCVYNDTISGQLKAQTSYAVLTDQGILTFRAIRDNNTGSSLSAIKMTADQLPDGATDGYFFKPTPALNEMGSTFRYPGATILVGHQEVTISFMGFDKLTPGSQKAFVNHAVTGAISVQQHFSK